MATFIPVKYHNKTYPDGIVPPITEVAGHFDKDSILDVSCYSLHTEYSFGKRKLSNPLLDDFPSLRNSQNGVPMLWSDDRWSSEFADFIKSLTKNVKPPTVIEIHPPFTDYCPTAEDFLKMYSAFEDSIRSSFPNVTICIENRTGTYYRNGRFLLSTIEDMHNMMESISENGYRLKFAVDYPQLFTAYYRDGEIMMDDFIEKHSILDEWKKMISSIHLWGKKPGRGNTWVAHAGDLNTYFRNNMQNKQKLLDLLREFYDDGISRYFVPEVNSSSEYLQSIVEDCMSAGIVFEGEIYIDY